MSAKRLGDENFPKDTQEETGGGAKTTESKEHEIVLKSESTTGMYPNSHSCDYDQDSDTKESASRALMKSQTIKYCLNLWLQHTQQKKPSYCIKMVELTWKAE